MRASSRRSWAAASLAYKEFGSAPLGCSNPSKCLDRFHSPRRVNHSPACSRRSVTACLNQTQPRPSGRSSTRVAGKPEPSGTSLISSINPPLGFPRLLRITHPSQAPKHSFTASVVTSGSGCNFSPWEGVSSHHLSFLCFPFL